MECSKVMSFFGILLWISFASDAGALAWKFGSQNFRLPALICSLGKRVIANNSHLAFYCNDARQSQPVDKDVGCSCGQDDICTPRNCRLECKTNEECPNNRSCIVQKCRDPCPGFCGVEASCQVILHQPHCTCPIGYAGDPRARCYPRPTSQVPPREDPCSSSPCGTNARCDEGECTCIDGYHGDPYKQCYPDCSKDANCPDDRACIDNECADPCPEAHCASSAMCEVIGHIAKCNCPPEMTGNPRVECYKEIPTIIPGGSYDPVTEAVKLHEALIAEPPNLDDVVDVTAYHTRTQRHAIGLKYRDTLDGFFGNDLYSTIRKVDVDFYESLVGLYLVLPLFLSQEFHWALTSSTTSAQSFTRTLIALNNTETQEVMNTYNVFWPGEPPEDYLNSRIGGSFAARIVKSQLNGERSEDPSVNEEAASNDARAIYDEGQANKWASNDSVFISVLTTKSYPQLQRTFEIYEKIAGRPLQDAIERQFKDAEDAAAYVAIVRRAKSKVELFTHELKKAVSTSEYDFPTIIRIIVWRADIDLGNIKQKYEETVRTPKLSDVLKAAPIIPEWQRLLLTLANL